MAIRFPTWKGMFFKKLYPHLGALWSFAKGNMYNHNIDRSMKL